MMGYEIDMIFGLRQYLLYLVNRSPHTSLNFKVPEEIWSGNPVDYSNLTILDVLHMHMSVMVN